MVVFPVPTSPVRNDETLAAVNAVNQVRQRLLMLPTAIEEGRIRTQVEWVFTKAKESVIHRKRCRSRWGAIQSIACVFSLSWQQNRQLHSSGTTSTSRLHAPKTGPLSPKPSECSALKFPVSPSRLNSFLKQRSDHLFPWDAALLGQLLDLREQYLRHADALDALPFEFHLNLTPPIAATQALSSDSVKPCTPFGWAPRLPAAES